MKKVDRRRVLRGLLNGGAVTVALPLLDCFLDGNGQALADGKPMPVRFGTWFWGCGMNAKAFTPKTFGTTWELQEENAALQGVQKHLNLFSNFNAYLDSAPKFCHYSGWVVCRSGAAPQSQDHRPGETIDMTISKKIGRTTRFQQLTATATGDVRVSNSYENQFTPNAAEWSPLNFYTRLFGPDFQDPNAPSFTPSPRVMVRKSVLSGVMEQTHAMGQTLGAADKARLDQFFTGLRDLERQFDQQLTKPEPLAACHPAKAPKDPERGISAQLVAARHNMMADLLAMAVACDQTRVFNMAYSAGFAATTKPGYEKPHHTCTHEEATDAKLGYQQTASWFTTRAMESFAHFVTTFQNIKEGDGTLLDHCLIFANSETSLARLHSFDGLPMFTAGRAGGRLKTGYHIDGASSPVSRVGYTLLHVMGAEAPSWGEKSNQTAKEIGEILA
jgi:hypothetical protein